MSTLNLEPIKERLDKAHTEWGPWKAKEEMMELLPDLPGTITGIKCKDPFIVQCPTCGDCYTSRARSTSWLDPHKNYV